MPAWFDVSEPSERFFRCTYGLILNFIFVRRWLY
jgi:hypothetical protein